MYEEKSIDNVGKINISEEVIAVVSSVASLDVPGVASMCTTLVEGITDFFGKKNYSRGVKSVIEGEDVKISVFITVDFGCHIPTVSCEVQEKVKREVETMTSLNVTSVDVYVNGIAMPKTEKPNNSKAKKQ